MTAPELATRPPRGLVPGGGGWLRIALAVATAATLAVLWVPGLHGEELFIQIAAGATVLLWVVLRPGSAAPTLLLVGALCLRIFSGHPTLDGSLIGMTVLLPLVHQLAALAVVVPVGANVEWAALLPTAVRYLGAVTATVAGLLISSVLGWW